jgi:hypothetical protein
MKNIRSRLLSTNRYIMYRYRYEYEHWNGQPLYFRQLQSQNANFLIYLELIALSQCSNGDLAQLAARMLSMHKVAGSIPAISTEAIASSVSAFFSRIWEW